MNKVFMRKIDENGITIEEKEIEVPNNKVKIGYKEYEIVKKQK